MLAQTDKETKVHLPVDADWAFKRQRHLTLHIDNCDLGYDEGPVYTSPYATRRTPLHNVHHILCICTCADDNFPKGADAARIRLFLAPTDWDINAKDNVIALPQKPSYQFGTYGAWNGYPCHQVDHDLYWKTARDYVRTVIFRTIQERDDADDCESIAPDKIKQLFLDATAHWKSFFARRGKDSGGTLACFEYRKNGVVSDAMEHVWFVPFSMSPDPEAAQDPLIYRPPVDVLKKVKSFIDKLVS